MWLYYKLREKKKIGRNNRRRTNLICVSQTALAVLVPGDDNMCVIEKKKKKNSDRMFGKDVYCFLQESYLRPGTVMAWRAPLGDELF